MKRIYFLILVLFFNFIFSQTINDSLKVNNIEEVNLSKYSIANWKEFRNKFKKLDLIFEGTAKITGFYIYNQSKIPFYGSLIYDSKGLQKIKIKNEVKPELNSTLDQALYEYLKVVYFYYQITNKNDNNTYNEYCLKFENENKWYFQSITNISKESLGIDKNKNVNRIVLLDKDGVLKSIKSTVTSSNKLIEETSKVHSHNFDMEFTKYKNGLKYSFSKGYLLNIKNGNKIDFTIVFTNE